MQYFAQSVNGAIQKIIILIIVFVILLFFLLYFELDICVFMCSANANVNACSIDSVWQMVDSFCTAILLLTICVFIFM